MTTPATLEAIDHVVMPLSSDEIFAIDDRRYEMLPMPEWGGRAVRVRSLGADEWDSVEDAMTRLATAAGPAVTHDAFRSRVALLGLVDDAGVQLFDVKDQAKLGAKGSNAIGRICAAVIRLTQVPPEDVEALTERLNGAPAADVGDDG